MSCFTLSYEEVRSIILNAHKIKEFNKCSDCAGTGWENWNEEGGDPLPGRLSEFSTDREEGECATCEGVGYVDFLMYCEE